MNDKCTIIITSYSNKKYILRKLSQDKKLYNLKFFTFSDLKKKLFFDYDDKSLAYVMKNYHVPLSVAKTYLDNLYYLKNISNEKIKFLMSLKKDLDEQELLIYDSHFKTYLNSKKVIVYGYRHLSKEQNLIVQEIAHVQVYARDKKEYKPIVFELSNEMEEVEYVLNRISKLYLDGVFLDKIKIIASLEYTNILNYYFSLYQIPIHLKSRHSYYSTFIAQEFLEQYDSFTIQENIEKLKDKYENLNDFITIVNRSVEVHDKDIRKEFIIRDLKNTKINSTIYDFSVEVASLEDTFLDDEYVFLFGFHIGAYPKVYQNDGYLSDGELSNLGLDTSLDKNRHEKQKLIEKIKSIKNLTITCVHSNGKTIFPSLLIKEMNLEVKPVCNNPFISYSKLNTKLKYACDLDNFYKFNIVGENLSLYRNSGLSLDYLAYSNDFSGISMDTLKERIGPLLTLAYTNMEMYNECAFKYYLSKILKIDIFEENFKSNIGTIAHHILELGLSKEINLSVEMSSFIKEKDYRFTSKEYFYLEKLREELEFILAVLKKQEKHSKLRKYLFESELCVYFDQKDINVTFKGLIDKVMYENINGEEILAVVDYKTGNPNITLDYLNYGLNIQLPIYLYLLKKSDRFKDAQIAGFYLQKILGNVLPVSDKKTLKERKEENLRLQGYSNSSCTILELLDDEYLDSKLIKGLRFKKDGSLYSSAKVLSSVQMEELTEVVDKKIKECITNILEGNYEINPKVINGKNVACLYCKFKDICFKTKSNEVMIGGVENEMDRGTMASD